MTPATRHRLLLGTLAGAALATPAWAIDSTIFGTGAVCVSGSCTNGEGTIRIQDGTETTGAWSQGRYLDGRSYQVRSPLQPARTTEMVYNSDGIPVRGTLLRGDPFSMKAPIGEFSGSFAAVANPFVAGGRSFSYSVGKYTDLKTGLVFDGEFSYVPMRVNGLVSGTMIFQGVRIDNETDEVVRGLFVSEQVFAGHPILLRKARPDYLVKLQRDFEAEQVGAAAETRATEDRQRSGENMASLLGVMGGLMAISGGGGGNRLGALQSNSLAGLTGALTGKQSSGDILKGVLAQVAQQAGADPTLARALGGATQPGDLLSNLSGLGKTGQTMTRAQYAAQMLAVAGNRDAAAPAQGLATAPIPARAGADAVGTVALHYTPGKGLLDPVTGRFVRSPDELSCDNLTTRGQRLRDLPADVRSCRSP
jgi:hypothetical protein